MHEDFMRAVTYLGGRRFRISLLLRRRRRLRLGGSALATVGGERRRDRAEDSGHGLAHHPLPGRQVLFAVGLEIAVLVELQPPAPERRPETLRGFPAHRLRNDVAHERVEARRQLAPGDRSPFFRRDELRAYNVLEPAPEAFRSLLRRSARRRLGTGARKDRTDDRLYDE